MPGPLGRNDSHLSNTQVNDTAIEINAAPGSIVNVEVVNNNVSNQTQSLYPEQDCCCCDDPSQPAHESPETGGPFGAPVRGMGSHSLFGPEPAQQTGSHGDFFGTGPSHDSGANPGHGTGSHGDAGAKPSQGAWGFKPGHEMGGYGQGGRREPPGTNQELAPNRGWLSPAGRTTGLQRLLDFLAAHGWLRRTRH